MEYLVILGALGPTELIAIVLVVVLLFGGRKIPELMKGIGEGMKQFKKASREGDLPEKTETTSDTEKK
jgi:sec-independent protein translocase protein TatA